MTLTPLDWILLGMLGLSVIIGLWRGFIEEVMSLGGWFVAGATALYLAGPFSLFLVTTGLSDNWRYVTALIIIFVVMLIVWNMLTALIKNAIGAVGLGFFDRLMGGVFGGARGVLLLTFFAVLLSYTPVSATDFWTESKTIPLLSQSAQQLKPYLPASAAGFIP
jgi:membrane protein required for colicin V production